MKAALVLLVCVVGAETSVADFLLILSDQATDQWEYVWSFIKQAIKRPARVKKVGFSNDRIIKEPTPQPQPITAVKIKTTTYKITTQSDVTSLAFLHNFNKRKQLLIPALARPRWRTREEWSQMQRPHLTRLLSRPMKDKPEKNWGMSTVDVEKLCTGKLCVSPLVITETIEGDVTTARQDRDIADEDIGVMMFI